MEIEWQKKFSTICFLLVLSQTINISITGAVVVASTTLCNSSISFNVERNLTIGTNTAPRYGIVTVVYATGDGTENLVLDTSSSQFYLEKSTSNDLTWIVRLSVCLNAGDTATLELTLISDEAQTCDYVSLSVTVVPTIPLFALSDRSDHPHFGSQIRSCDPAEVVNVARVMNAAWCISFNCSVTCSNDAKRFWTKEDEPSKIVTDGRDIIEGKHYELEATCTETNKATQTEVHTAVRFMSVRFNVQVTCTTPSTTTTASVFSAVSTTIAQTTPAGAVTSRTISENAPSTGKSSIQTTHLSTSDIFSTPLGNTSLMTLPTTVASTIPVNVLSQTQSIISDSPSSPKTLSTSSLITASIYPKPTTHFTATFPPSLIPTPDSASTNWPPSQMTIVTIDSASTNWQPSQTTIPSSASTNRPPRQITTDNPSTYWSPSQMTTVYSASTKWLGMVLNTSTQAIPPAQSNGVLKDVTTDFMNNPANVAAVATTGAVIAGVGITLAARKLCTTISSESRPRPVG